MKLQIKYHYREGYLPTKRHRILRYREMEDKLEITINEVMKENTPVALLVHSYDNSITEYRLWNGKLWTKTIWNEVHCNKEGLLPISELQWYIRGIYDYWNYTREEIKESYQKDADKYLIIDGIIYKETGEPRYVSMTFGLGHNHGGTSLMIDNYYNSNINKDSYFNALERDKAIEYTKQRAINRGDTEDVNRIGKSYNIEVLIPEAIKCNPQKEHGDGDHFLNSLDSITERSSNANEAGILVLCLLANELNK